MELNHLEDMVIELDFAGKATLSEAVLEKSEQQGGICWKK